MKSKREIIEINEELCNGCGQCVSSCAEGAIEIVGGKAKLKAELYCDGLGACLGHCPEGALKIIVREADEFDEKAVHELLKNQAAPEKPRACPGSAALSLSPKNCAGSAQAIGESQLGNWPVKLRLVQPSAPFLKNSRLLLAADCVPVAVPDFQHFVQGLSVVIACPKFDDVDSYVQKLAEIFRHNDTPGVTLLRMEVPCCAGLAEVVKRAVAASGREIAVDDLIVTRQGKTLRPEQTLKSL